MRELVRAVILSGLLLGSYRANAADRLAVADLRHQIDKAGATEIITRMPPATWDWITDQVADGRTDWIAILPLLARGTDAGYSEDLGISAALALPKAPEAVLTVIAPYPESPLRVEVVCGVPFIEDSVKDIPGYIRRARAAVRGVHQPDLRARKAACLTQLGEMAR